MRASIGWKAPALALWVFCASVQAADGDLDPSFGTDGFRITGITDAYSIVPLGMAVQPDGKIVACGGEGTYPAVDFYVARFTADGELDASFSFDGRTTIDFGGNTDICNGLAIQTDGKIVVAGSTQPDGDPNVDFAVARLNADGTLDTATFGAGTGKSVVGFDLGGTNADNVGSLVLKPDGRIVVAGYATTPSNGTDFAILQLNTDGSRDTSFNLTGRATIGFDLAASTNKNDVVTSIALDAQGRIVVAGSADAGTAGGTDFAVARLLASGQPDPDFSADGRAVVAFDLGGASGSNDDGAYAVTILHDGRIALGGVTDSSTTTDLNQDIAIVRLLPDGSPDASFGFGGRTTIAFDLGPNGQDLALGMIERSGGRLLLAGAALQPSINGIVAAAVSLRRDGSPDPGFGTLGKRTYDFAQTTPSGQLFSGIGVQPGKGIVFTGVLNVVDSTHVDMFAARVLDDSIFADGFD
jgi:uncharacterized delta-60 repeat protein